jgi:hypothetical protein
MIPLPPGCSVAYGITIDITAVTDELIEWYELVGGEISEKEVWTFRGRKQIVKSVKYGKSKLCHHRADGSGGVRLHFRGEDASTASVFLIKFYESVEQHNMKEMQDHAY